MSRQSQLRDQVAKLSLRAETYRPIGARHHRRNIHQPTGLRGRFYGSCSLCGLLPRGSRVVLALLVLGEDEQIAIGIAKDDTTRWAASLTRPM